MTGQSRTRTLEARARRRRRVRATVTGTARHPRLAVFRSNKHIVAQIIDDAARTTLVAVHDRELSSRGSPIAVAEGTGELLGKKAVAQHITHVVFDRRGYRYHGRVKALADGARKAGLVF